MAATLPEDVLCSIMLDTAPIRIQHKVALASVCRHWRATASSHVLLWASLNASTPDEHWVLPLALLRSGNVPLQLELHCAAKYIAGDYHESLRTLHSVFHRLRRLVLDARCHTAFPDFLSAGEEMPLLEHFEVSGRHDLEGAPLLNMRAPSLRQLVLHGFAFTVQWDTILARTLEHVEIHHAKNGCGLVTLDLLFRRCPRMRELHFSMGTGGDAAQSDAILPALSLALRQKASALQLLHLHGIQYLQPTERLLQTLADARVVPSHVRLLGVHARIAEPLFVQLLRHVDPVVEFRAETSGSCPELFLETASGQKRELWACDVSRTWHAPLQVMQLHTVRRVVLSTFALERIVHKRFSWPALDLLEIRGDITGVLRVKWQLDCAAVSKLVLELTGPPAPARDAVMEIVSRVRRRMEACEGPTLVCIGATRLDASDTGHATARDNIRRWLGRYDYAATLCTKCCGPVAEAK